VKQYYDLECLLLGCHIMNEALLYSSYNMCVLLVNVFTRQYSQNIHNQDDRYRECV